MDDVRNGLDQDPEDGESCDLAACVARRRLRSSPGRSGSTLRGRGQPAPGQRGVRGGAAWATHKLLIARVKRAALDRSKRGCVRACVG